MTDSKGRKTVTRRRKRAKGEDPADTTKLAAAASASHKQRLEREGRKEEGEKARRPRERRQAEVAEKRNLVDGSQLEQIASMSRGDLERLLGGVTPARAVKKGDRVEGVVIKTSPAILVSIGGKSEGVIDREELETAGGELTVREGDSISAVVLGWSHGALRLGVKLRGEDAGEHLRLAHEQELSVEGTVTEKTKGGFKVNVGGVRCFCPISHMDLSVSEEEGAYIGEKLQFEILELKEGEAVLSRRRLLREIAEEEKGALWAGLEVGTVHSGTVSNVTNFGAFVNVGGLEGLVHVSEISHDHVPSPAALLQKGQSVQVKIIGVDPVERRLSLSMREAAEPTKSSNEQVVASSQGELGTLGDLFGKLKL